MNRREFRTSGAINSLLAGLLSAILVVPAAAQSSAPGDGGKAAPASGGLTVTPLRIELSSDERSESITLHNGFQKPMAVQARIFTWTQVNGEDVYAPSTDHMITPSIMLVPPGESQLVRVLRKAAGSAGEKPYRLVLDQLPDGAASDQTGTQSRIRFVLPLFVDRDKAAPVKLDWRLDNTGLRLINQGGSTARVLNVVVKKASGDVAPVKDGDLRYVLGASSINYALGNGCALGRVKVTAMVDGEPIDVEPTSACG